MSNPLLNFSVDDVTDIIHIKSKVETIIDFIQIDTPFKNIKSDYILAGGAFPSIHHIEQVRDVDIFLLDDQDISFDDLKRTRSIIEHDGDYLKALENDMIKKTVKFSPLIANSLFREVQFILTKYKTREELIQHFDFVHCKMNYQSGKLFVSSYVFNAIKDKTLINNHDRVQKWRIDKYQDKGYSYSENAQTFTGRGIRPTGVIVDEFL
jgi:hypothetical protein